MDCCMLSDMLFSIETLKYCRDIAGEIKGAKTSIKADNGESALKKVNVIIYSLVPRPSSPYIGGRKERNSYRSRGRGKAW